MTSTQKITYRWFERNHLGEPLPLCRYSRELTDDESSLHMLAQASDRITITEAPEPPMTKLQFRLRRFFIGLTLIVAFSCAVTCFEMWGAK
jgi:hypothetical protein